MSLQLTDGSVFASRYKIVRRIAMGGMGAVYEVEHTETLRRLALKVMLPHIVQSAEMRERFRREARVAAHIESEHIVGVFDAGIDDPTGMPFIVMELLRGEELAQALRRAGHFAPADVVTFLHQAALALDKTHKASIVHRDLKPENLFLTLREDGQPRVKVLDFGIAKLVAEGATQDAATKSLGTPLYMAPEQFRSGYPVSPATDIYALGMIAFTLLVGASYWADEAKDSSNIFVFAGAVMAGPREPASARAHRRGVRLSPAFDFWFARITAMDPGQRHPSALAAVGDLAQVLGVAPPAGIAAATTGSMSVPGLAPAPAASGPTGAPAVSLGVSGALPASTGSAYGATTGGPPRSRSTGKLLAAIVAAIVLTGAAVTAFLVMRLPGEAPPPANAGPVPASASAAPVAAAPSSAVPTPTPTPTEKPAASAAVAPATASAQPAVAAPTAPVPTAGAGHAPAGARKGPAPPAETGKKSIFVRD